MIALEFNQEILQKLVEEIKANQLAIRRLEERVKELETKKNKLLYME